MPIYTKKGDRGQTSLLGGGGKVGKADLRVEAYGSVDELQSLIGVVLAFLPVSLKTVRGQFVKIQRDLFEIEAELSTPAGGEGPFRLASGKVKKLESLIDKYDGQLPKLRNFIFPGGGACGSFLGLCRTVCRRTERAVVRLSDKEGINPRVLAYLNRLSDLFFVYSRWINKVEGVREEKWEGTG